VYQRTAFEANGCDSLVDERLSMGLAVPPAENILKICKTLSLDPPTPQQMEAAFRDALQTVEHGSKNASRKSKPAIDIPAFYGLRVTTDLRAMLMDGLKGSPSSLAFFESLSLAPEFHMTLAHRLAHPQVCEAYDKAAEGIFAGEFTLVPQLLLWNPETKVMVIWISSTDRPAKLFY
jgi:hypothetical protein